MTDQELLECAAKAAEIKCEFIDEVFIGKGLGSDGRDWPWNPLTDDGDALRLAVNLNLDVEFVVCDGGAEVWACATWRDWPITYTELLDQDKFAATRRAIVRAAAEIGKDKK